MNNKKQKIVILFGVLIFIIIPVIIHTIFKGSYVITPEGDRRTFWIGPISTTLPYIILAIVFFANSSKLKTQNKSLTGLCVGTAMAWLSMMSFTYYLINQTPAPELELSSTIGIAITFTPFFYIPFLVVPYAIGSIIGIIIEKFKNRKTV